MISVKTARMKGDVLRDVLWRLEAQLFERPNCLLRVVAQNQIVVVRVCRRWVACAPATDRHHDVVAVTELLDDRCHASPNSIFVPTDVAVLAKPFHFKWP